MAIADLRAGEIAEALYNLGALIEKKANGVEVGVVHLKKDTMIRPQCSFDLSNNNHGSLPGAKALL